MNAVKILSEISVTFRNTTKGEVDAVQEVFDGLCPRDFPPLPEVERGGARLPIRLVTYLLAAAFLFSSAGLEGVEAAQKKQAPDLLHELNDSLQTLTQQVSSAVVQILATGYGPVREGLGVDTSFVARHDILGSGVIVDPDGYILTNAHVVEGAQRIRVVLTSRSQGGLATHSILPARGPTLAAKIVGVDARADLALLKVEASGLAALAFGNYSELRQGQLVLALGSPQGFENSVSFGVVSSVARQPKLDSPMVYIQTDAPINPGDSGGPLVDVDGKVVGINTYIISESGGSEGIGFAIPSAIARFVYQQLRQYGHVHRPEIGASVQTVTPTLATGLRLVRDSGVIISDVAPGGPAEAAGLEIQDIILTFEGETIQNLPQFEANLYRHVGSERVKLEVLRGTEKVTLEMPVAERRDEVDRVADTIDPTKNLIPKLGIVGIQIDRAISDRIPELRIKSGIIVAARAGNPDGVPVRLPPGDVIHSINGIPIITLETLRSAIRDLKPGAAVAMQIEREGKLMYVAFTME